MSRVDGLRRAGLMPCPSPGRGTCARLVPIRILLGAILMGGLILDARGEGASPAGPTAAQEPAADSPRRVVIPFDFESKFDRGAYGQTIGEMIWTKLRRRGGFILPEAEQDVRDWCRRAGMVPGPDTPLARMKEIVAGEQAGDIGIWGKVERVAGHETDVYDLWIAVADFSVDPPRMIYQKTARTRTVSEIPHVYVREALDALYGRPEAMPAVVDPGLEERWKSAPNLVQGDFERGRAAPLGWDRLPAHVAWIRDEKGTNPKNRAIRFTLDEDVAGTTGVLYYSDFFPIEEGATYRFRCSWKTSGSAVKVFIKCYDALPTEFRGRAAAGPAVTERREVYRSQQNLQGSPGAWNVHTEDFTPLHARFDPRWGRVMLYAYWPAGTVDWDDIVVKQVAPAPTGLGARTPPRSGLLRRPRTGPSAPKGAPPGGAAQRTPAEAAPNRGGPGDGRLAARRPGVFVPSGPPAPVPPEVTMPRPTAAELAGINADLERFIKSNTSPDRDLLVRFTIEQGYEIWASSVAPTLKSSGE